MNAFGPSGSGVADFHPFPAMPAHPTEALYFWHQLPYAVPGFLTFLVGMLLASFALYAVFTRSTRRLEFLALTMVCAGASALGLVLGLRAVVLDRALLLRLHDAVYPLALLLVPGSGLLTYALTRRHRAIWLAYVAVALVTVVLGWVGLLRGQAFSSAAGHAFSFGYYPSAGPLLRPWGVWAAVGALPLIATLAPEMRSSRIGRRVLAIGLFLLSMLSVLNVPALLGYPLFPPATFGFLPLSMVAYGVFRDDFLDLNELLFAKRGLYYVFCGLFALVFSGLALLVAFGLAPALLDSLNWKGWPAIPLVSALSVFGLAIFVAGSNPRERLNLLAGGTFFGMGLYTLMGVLRTLPLEPIVALRLEQLAYVGFAFYPSLGLRLFFAALALPAPRWIPVVDLNGVVAAGLALTPLLLRGQYAFDFARVSASGPATTVFFVVSVGALCTVIPHIFRGDHGARATYVPVAVVLSSILIALGIPATRGVRFYSFGNLQVLPALFATVGVLRRGPIGVRTEATRVAQRLTLVAMAPLALFSAITYAVTPDNASSAARALHTALVLAPVALVVFLFLFVFSQPIAERLEDETRTREEATRKQELEATAARTAQEIAKQLDEKNAALARMDQLKDDFLANTSHELRTPLNAIVGLVESTLDEEGTHLSRTATRSLQMVVTSSRRLTSLIDDILDFAKLRDGSLALDRRPVDVRSAVDVALTLTASLAAAKKLTLSAQIPESTPNVLADENRLQQILVNLLGNAIKFTAEGTVTVTAGYDGDEFGITVADTGIGISTTKLPRIFEPFVQADGSVTREHGGTGLGLAITKQLVELHGGSIRVVSKVGRGSRFTVFLPTTTEPEVARETRPPTSDAEPLFDDETTGMLRLVPARRSVALRTTLSRTLTGSEAEPARGTVWSVLAVDDDPVNLAVLAGFLRKSEYRVTLASSGLEALELMAKQPFDAVLLDVMMPKLSGYETCRRIREKHRTEDLPVLLLTAKGRADDIVHGFAVGANDYLVKPLARSELLARLHLHVSLAKTHGAYARFVPQEFFRLLGKKDALDVGLGDHIARDLTVLFCDVRDFTGTTERMTPEEAFRFVSEIFYAFSPAIRENGGFIDKFIGDAVMALFPGSPRGALKAAIAMVDATQWLTASLGVRELKIGIGIHTGPVILGTLGDEQRMEATVISDTVNLASRIEGLTKPFGVSILVSEQTLAGVKNAELYGPRRLGQVRVRGKEQPVSVFEVVSGDATTIRNMKLGHEERFDEAVRLFESGAVSEARGAFEEILSTSPKDGPARYYREQCVLHERGLGAREGVLAIE